MNKLVLSPLAQADLQEIRSYIADELQNPTAAANALKRITARLRSLMTFPAIGAPLSSIIDIETDYRFLVCGNYTAYYRLKDDAAYVIRVLCGRRNFMKILFGNAPETDTGTTED